MSKIDDILQGFFGKGACMACGSRNCDGSCQMNPKSALQGAMASYQQAIGQWNASHQRLASSAGFAPGQVVHFNLGGNIVTTTGAAPDVLKIEPLPQEEIICATGGIVGWREWRVQNFGDVLYSFNGEAWPARKPLRASCKSDSTASCRGEHCTCGLYAWKQRASLTVNDTQYNRLRGEVWMWGKVIEHELGYRAEYQYPKSFMDTGADARRLSAIYGVKVIAL